MKAEICGVQINAVVDTGAETTFIGPRVAKLCQQNGIPMTKEQLPVACLADGSTSPIQGRMTVPIKILSSTHKVRCMVLAETAEEVFLGMDAIRHLGIIIDAAAHKIFIRRTSAAPVKISSVQAGLVDMTSEQQGTLGELLEQEMLKFNKVKGRTQDVQHTIKVKANVTPVKQRYFPCNPAKQTAINAEVDKMLEEDVIERSHSPWSSNIVLVKKKSGENRFCVDYRKVNELTEKDSYPLPFITHILNKLRGSTFFSTLDLRSGYWQIPLTPESRPVTAFTVPGRGLFQFKVLPFGLHSAPACFQRFLDTIISPELEDIALVYLDDIIVLGADFQTHLRNLRIVFNKLREAGLQLQPEKCHFAKTSIQYLGHVVSREGIQTDPEKVAAILHVSPPKTRKEVRSFLGLLGWYRSFLPLYSEMTAPLTHLLKKGIRWKWGEEQQLAFQKLKEALTKSPILVCPDYSKEFEVHTDACDKGLGSALIQKIGGVDRVVAYASRTLSPAEQKYSATEKECLAVVWSLKKFRTYLEGYKFKVVTDHQSLKWLRELQNPSGRLCRWAIDLQEFDFTIEYRKGALNILADALSRNPLPRNTREDLEIAALFLNNNCEWYNKLMDEVVQEPAKHPDYSIYDGDLYRKFPGKPTEDPATAWKLCVPKPDRDIVLKEIHDDPEAGHLGTTKTSARAALKYYWPGMFRDVRTYVRKCESCNKFKFNQAKPYGEMYYRHLQSPGQLISVDLMGPFPKSKKGHMYLLVFQDCFTKWVELHPLRRASTKPIIEAFKSRIIYRFGTPRTLISDNGSQFANRLFRSLADEFGIHHRFTAPYSPQENPVERTNRVIGPMLAQYVQEDQREWDRYLNEFMFAINTAKHESTGFSPSMLTYGREIPPPQSIRQRAVPVEEAADVPETAPEMTKEYVEELQKLTDLMTIAQQNLARAFQKQRHGYNLRHRPYRPTVGEWIYKKEHPLSSAGKYFSKKLAPKYTGPYQIKQIISPVILLLQNERGKVVGRVHVKDVKPTSSAV